MSNVTENIDEGKYLSRDQSMKDKIWIDSNTSKIDELLRINYDKSVEDFADIVLNAIGDLLEILRGVFYVVDPSEQKVEAAAGYACKIDTLVKKEFAIGDDLVGFAVKSKKMRCLDNLPVCNAVISSGLAKISSSFLIISPLLFNDEVYGVIELNCLTKLDEKSIELIERLSRNIASTLQSIENNEKTQLLLRELQDKTNMMETQEEELRQNLEELHAIQEAMRGKQSELEEVRQKLENNEKVLLKAMSKTREKESALKMTLKEKDLEINMLNTELERLKKNDE